MKKILQQNLSAGAQVKFNSLGPLLGNGPQVITGMKTATKLIEHFFSPLRILVSKAVFTLSSSGSNQGKVVINLFYYIASRDQTLSDSTINSLGEALSKLLQRPVELRLVRLHYPYLNSYILAQYVAINTKKYNFTRIQRAIFAAVQVVNQRTLFTSDITDSAPSTISIF